MTALESCLDLWLIGKARRGDKDAFGRLYDRHHARVFALLRRLTGSVEGAEDLTQETFLVAYASLNNWRGLGAFSTYLCGIAVRQYQAARRREQRLPTAGALEDDALVAVPHDDPLAHLKRREAEAALEEAIAALPETCREVFVLVRIEGMRYQTVAELLEIPIGTVRSRLNRATGLLHTHLSPLIYGDTSAADTEKGACHVIR